ncbi:MAG TPA: protein-glutamate O-methyltransferase CheR [Candidatus Angelobacter sp.]|nr:protein-glutamate O-methyltransferase CheR [Candidatus Angelobacter sp.]
MEDYQWFQMRIKEDTGIDLTLYKEEQMRRRLTSLCVKNGVGKFRELYQIMSVNPASYEQFLDKMTINVTEFFRNRQRWHILETKILPSLLKTTKRPLRIWSAACSTGEEPYSLSILLSQYLAPRDYSILATDLDEGVLNRAQSGIFTEKALKGLEQSEILRYFKREKNFYRVNEDIQKPVTFRKHNLLSDLYENGFDLIVCRNVMIYFTEEAKGLLYTRFSEALKQKGVLFVGSTEQIFNPKQYGLQPLDTFFYEKEGKGI